MMKKKKARRKKSVRRRPKLRAKKRPACRKKTKSSRRPVRGKTKTVKAKVHLPEHVKVVEKPTKEEKKKAPRYRDEEKVIGEELTLDKTPMRIYLQQIENIPLLTPEEEVDLAQKITEGGEIAKDARMRMIRSNLRLVISIAKRYSNIGLPFSDLVEEGNIGLMRAVDKFCHKRGYRFSTYASWWIKQAIMRALSNQGKTIRVPVYMYDIMAKWRKVRDGLTQKLGRTPTRKEVADVMNVSIRKVKEVERIASQPSSLNAPVSIDGTAEVIDLVEDQAASAATDSVHELFTTERIDDLLNQLDERAREILVLRFGLKGGEPQTLEETAKRFNITRERVRQIESASLEKIRSYLKGQEESFQDYTRP